MCTYYWQGCVFYIPTRSLSGHIVNPGININYCCVCSNCHLDYLKEIYPSQLTVEKANKSDHLAGHLDLTFIIDSGGKLSTRLYDVIMSIFHSFPATYHLVLLMVCIFHSSLDMHDAVHTMMISDITTIAWLIDFCHKAIQP